MHDGYDQDDIYIMVEDEFHTVAQSFTHHLHHAEYKRLQKKAREVPPRACPTPTSNMSFGTRQKLQARNLHEKQSSALEDITKDANTEEMEEKVDDPWSGMHLAGLMQCSGRPRTALVGLEKIPSSTRAAKGFGRGEGDSPDRKKQPMGIMEIFGGKKGKLQQETFDLNSDMEDDDLDISPPSRSDYSKHQTHKAKHTEATKLQEPALPSKPQSSAYRAGKATSTYPVAVILSQSRSNANIAGSRLIDNVDHFDVNPMEDSKPPAEPHTILDIFVKRKLAKERQKKARASEIPTFLDLT
jgi:hypothetical protein